MLHRRRIFGTVQTLEDPRARLRIPEPGFVERPLELDEQFIEDRLLGTACAHGRHHACAKLLDHPLGDFRVLRRPTHVESFEHEPSALSPLAVTARAVLLDNLVGIGRADVGNGDEMGCGGGGGDPHLASHAEQEKTRDEHCSYGSVHSSLESHA